MNSSFGTWARPTVNADSQASGGSSLRSTPPRALGHALLLPVVALTALILGADFARATPTIQTLSNGYLVSNGLVAITFNTAGGVFGGYDGINSIIFDGQQMVGSKGFYYDVQGSPNVYLNSTASWSYRTGSNFIDLAAEMPATASQPVDVTWHWIIGDGQAGYSSYITYNHTTAMADWQSTENRLGAQFYNESLFNYSSITDNFWGYQAAGNADRGEGRYVTAETSDMQGVPSEYIKNYETKYDWRSTYAQSGGVTGIVTAPNDTLSTKPFAATDFGAWTIVNPRSYEDWNAGPTHPQTPVADGASIIPSPPGSHFGGPTMVMTGNQDQVYGPIFNYFNTGPNLTALRNDAEQYASPTATGAYNLNAFYDSLNLPYYATTAQRGTVTGDVRIADGQSMSGATIILSSFDPAAYASDPISQEYQRRAAGYNYWIAANPDGTFSIPDVRPGTYRVTVIKPGNYREGTWDNIVVSSGSTTNVGNLTWQPDISGKGQWQIGVFDRTAGEFHDGNNYNNWLGTFDETKEFPNGVNYTVNPANPFNDTANWRANWPLYQENGTLDFFHVNFNLATLPAAGSTVTFTVAIAAQEFINSLGFSVNGGAQQYANFDHTADNAPSTYRSGDTTSRVLYRKINFTVGANGALSNGGTGYGSLAVGNNSLQLHIVGGNMQYDALRMDIQSPGTFSVAQFSGTSGNWSNAANWQMQPYGYTGIVKPGTSGDVYSTSTTFADGATNTAPINSTSASAYFDALLNGGTLTLDTSVAVQKLSLLQGVLSAGAGSPVLTASDAMVLGGATFNGSGTINALSTTTVNFANTISGGAKVNSTGPVTWIDGFAAVTVTGTGSQWNSSGLSFGQSGASTLTISSGGLVSTGSGTLIIGPQGMVSVTGGTLATSGINNAGSFTSGAPIVATGTGLLNAGTAAINGFLSGTSVTNTGGILLLSGTNAYTGATTISGGLVQFAAATSIGGSGASVTVTSGGAVSYLPGIANPAFLARLNPASQGSLALTTADSAAALNFTAGSLAQFAGMSLGAAGNATYSGVYTPSGGVYRLGGGIGTLTYTPVIGGAAALVIGNSGSTGAVVVNNANSFTGTTTIKGSILAISALANGGANSALGSSSSAAANLVIDGGTLQATGAATTNRLFTVGSNGATLTDASGSMNWTNPGLVVLSGAGNRTIALTGSSAANAFSPIIGDPASGVTALTKDGPGTWTLNSVQTYSGDTLILNGTLKLGTSSALPFGAGKGNLVIAISGGLEMNGHDLSINALNDGPVPTGGSAGPNGNGGGTLTNSSGMNTLTVGNANASGLFSSVIGGGINLVKVGGGLQVLSGDSTYTGTTTINGGSLQVGVGGTPSSYGPGDGGFRGMLGSGNVINNATLVFNRGYYTTCANTISGSGTLKQIANAELVLGTANTYTGPTLIGGGIANIGLGGPDDGTGLPYSGDCSLGAAVLANGGAASSIGASTSAATNLILDGGTLYYSNTNSTSTNRLFTVTPNGGAIYASGGLTFSNPGAIAMSGSGDRSLSLGGDSTTACTFDSDIGDPPAGGKTTLVKDRSANWIIGPTSALTYTGDTHLYMGTLTLGAGVALPYGPGKGNVVFDTSTDFSGIYPATLDIKGNDENINGLAGGLPYYSFLTNTSGTHTLTLGNADATAEFDGVISGGINLVKVGSGTETLTAACTYVGSTAVSGGALVFSGTAAIGGSGKNVTIANGAMLAAPAATVSQAFLNRLVTASSGVMALTTSETANLDFSSSGANLPNVSLGAVGAVTYSGMITPSGTTYQLGGGGGVLTVTSPLTGSRSLAIGGIGSAASAAGTVVLANTNSYTGNTTVSAGAVVFDSAASIGGSGASVFVAPGAVAAAGYPINQAFLARITPTSSGVVALAANSANNLDFSTSGANLPTVTLGAVGAATYSGMLTPAGSGFRFGGGGGALSINKAAALAGTYSVTVGLGGALPAAAANPLTLNISTAQSYSGSTTLRAGGTVAGVLANGGAASAVGASPNAAGNLVFDGGTLLASGATDRLFTLTANGGTITTAAALNFNNTGSVVLPSGANVTLTLSGADTNHNLMNVSLANPSGGTLGVVKNGSGKWTFSAGSKTYSGDTHVMAGTLEELASNAFSANSNMVIDSGAAMELHDNSATVNGVSGAGSVFDSFAAHARTLTLGAAGGSGTFTGAIPAGTLLSLIKTGTGTQVFGGATTVGQVTVGPTVGDTAVLTIPAGGLLNAGATTAPSVQIATVSGGSGTLNLTGGTLTTASEVWISTVNGAHGVVNMSGGVAQIGSWLAVGRGGNDGTLNVSGGSLVVLTNNLTLASFAGNRGTLNVSGGTVNAVNSINVGESGTGSMTLSGSGLAISNATLYVGKNAGSSGILQLNGGTLSAPNITSGGTGVIYFNGGAVIASASSGNFLNVTSAFVQSGGAAINAGGNSVTIAQPLLHYSAGTAADGGLSLSNGTLVLTRTNSYTGPTSISAGTLQLGVDQFGQDGSIANTSGVLDNAALVYNLAGSQTASYSIGGSGSLAVLGAGTLTLSGTNSYLGGTTVAGGTLIFSNNEAIADGTSLTVGNSSFFSSAPVAQGSALGVDNSTTPVPEPATAAILAAGAALLMAYRKRHLSN